MSNVDNESRVRRAVEAICNRGELEAADLLFHLDYVNRGGLIPDLIHGPEAIKLSIAGYRLAFPDLHIAIEELVTDEETVVLHWTAYSHPPVRIGGNASTAKHRLLTGITRLRLAGGMIMESRTQWDRTVARPNES